MIEPFIDAIGNGAISKQRGQALLAGVEQRPLAANVQIRFLLPGEARIRHLLLDDRQAEEDRLLARLQQTGERLTLAVADTGMGIPVGVDIFEPFVTTKSEGTGLGLAIVRQIIAAHSGTLNYTSVPGKGTTFVVTLPFLPVPEQGRPSSALGVTA